MIEHVYKKSNKKGVEKYKYFSAPFLDIYFPKRENIIKNYILEPDIQHIR